MRPVLVGIAPSREGSEGQPLTSLGGASTGHTLAGLAGLSDTQYLLRFDRVNLCPTPQPGTIPTGPGSVGRANAENLAGSLLRGRRVVLLGANVVECFGLKVPPLDLCRWYNINERVNLHHLGMAGFTRGHRPPFHFMILPHPSGRNRWYNDPANKARAAELMTELAEGWEGAD